MRWRVWMLVLVSLALGAQARLQVAIEPPALLDLRRASAAEWLPTDPQDPVQVLASQEASVRKVAPYLGRPSVRLLLPQGPGRIPLLLAASRALRAQRPSVVLYLGFDPAGEAIWDEEAWGAVQGGALLPQDLGPDPAAWPDLLTRAQRYLPGRPWTLWTPTDPGARLAELLGDGGWLVLPAGGPGAALAPKLPAACQDMAGGVGHLVVQDPATGKASSWEFLRAGWSPAELAPDPRRVEVTDQAGYLVGALLARVRAESFRERLAIRTLEADLSIDGHLTGFLGMGSDLGLRLHLFQDAGQPTEYLQQEVLLNGVRAKLPPEFRFPLSEHGPATPAWPVALMLNERYRYQDGGPAGAGRRKLLFDPVDGDPQLYAGSLVAEEETGRLVELRVARSGLKGDIRAESATLTFAEVAPGILLVVRSEFLQRVFSLGGLNQVQASATWTRQVINGPAFEEHRQAAVHSGATMFIHTPQGLRYFARPKAVP